MVHLFKEIAQKATSVQSFTQINLLIMVLVLSVCVNLEGWRWMKHKAEVL
jgi:competence protein ComGC